MVADALALKKHVFVFNQDSYFDYYATASSYGGLVAQRSDKDRFGGPYLMLSG